jgi:hypothetical protein
MLLGTYWCLERTQLWSPKSLCPGPSPESQETYMQQGTPLWNSVFSTETSCREVLGRNGSRGKALPLPKSWEAVRHEGSKRGSHCPYSSALPASTCHPEECWKESFISWKWMSMHSTAVFCQVFMSTSGCSKVNRSPPGFARMFPHPRDTEGSPVVHSLPAAQFIQLRRPSSNLTSPPVTVPDNSSYVQGICPPLGECIWQENASASAPLKPYCHVQTVNYQTNGCMCEEAECFNRFSVETTVQPSLAQAKTTWVLICPNWVSGI